VSAVDRLHKCPKCNVLLPSKNQLTQHKRKVHGKVAMAAGTGGAIPSSHGSVTYAVVSSPQQPTLQPSSSVVASLVSQVSQHHGQEDVQLHRVRVFNHPTGWPFSALWFCSSEDQESPVRTVSVCGIAKRHLKPSCEIEAQEKSRGAVLDPKKTTTII